MSNYDDLSIPEKYQRCIQKEQTNPEFRRSVKEETKIAVPVPTICLAHLQAFIQEAMEWENAEPNHKVEDVGDFALTARVIAKELLFLRYSGAFNVPSVPMRYGKVTDVLAEERWWAHIGIEPDLERVWEFSLANQFECEYVSRTKQQEIAFAADDDIPL